MANGADEPKPLEWVASAKRDVRSLPEDVKDVFGFALHQAQLGQKHTDAKSMKGLGGGVLEVVDDHDGSAYRAVYTVRFKLAVYVLHVFQKKSVKGNKTPQKEIETVKARLKVAEAHYQEKYARREEA